MAYIYRYQLRNLELRDRIILAQYARDIQSVLAEQFNKNLKDSIVEEKYFEFKLYVTVSRGALQEMGRKLKAKLPIYFERYGFVRMEQTLYALVYSSQYDSEDSNQNDIIHIELIDSMILDKNDLFMQRANSFFERKGNKGLLYEKGYSDNAEDVIKNYYVDILDAYIDKHSFPKFYNNTNEIRCFLVKGFHRHIVNKTTPVEDQSTFNLLPLENCIDIGFIENQKENGLEHIRPNHLDYLQIYDPEERPELVERIKNELRFYISPTESIGALNNINENLTGETGRYVFKVHNVGQALATSLSYGNAPPFLYFDYGMPYGRNSSTRPTRVDMPTNPETTIIISHVDMDHWFRVADDLNAYQCHWYIPNQPRRTQLNHKLAEVIVRGGSVHMIDSDVCFPCGKLTYGGRSKINPGREAKHVHETGLTLRIQAQDINGKELNILIAGDQRYDYVEQSQLDDLDILVASHHGGKYCWSTHGCVPTARNTGTSTIVYSYGDGNTYDHPDTENYIKANWIREHHTKDGDYETAINLCKPTEIKKLNLNDIADISLTWAKEPRGLDLHLYFRLDDSDVTHEVSYSSNNIKDVQYGGDITGGCGPENIHIKAWHMGIYDLWVNNFSGMPTLSQSNALISVVFRGTEPLQIKCPKVGSGDWWHVLRINTRSCTVEIINSYDNSDNPRCEEITI